HLAQDRNFLLIGSFVLLLVAVVMNIVGLNIGKWLQNAGGVGTYIPLLMLIGAGFFLWHRQGSVTHFTVANMLPHWNWDTVNFWPQIAFAFVGLELVSAMSEEIREPHKTVPRAIYASGFLIAIVYIAGTVAVLNLMPSDAVDPKSGVFQALTAASITLKIGAIGMIAALLAAFGNAGGVGTTVAGVARVPFVVGIDHYMPAAFGKIHPKWHTPYISILVQAIISAVVLVASQINETTIGAYQVLVDAATILYFIPFLYMYAAVIKLAYRDDRATHPDAALIPGGKVGVWLAGLLGFTIVIGGIVLSLIPPAEVPSRTLFEVKLIVGTLGAFLLGLVLYTRGARAKSRDVAHVAAN
ncbi:MAG TPA: APC family permease, partial [Candidatus Acidoferrales bacterium]|nr:APC family permease [Candidatus Acidoferrales bacterium]